MSRLLSLLIWRSSFSQSIWWKYYFSITKLWYGSQLYCRITAVGVIVRHRQKKKTFGDISCGAGWLSRGMFQAGLRVVWVFGFMKGKSSIAPFTLPPSSSLALYFRSVISVFLLLLNFAFWFLLLQPMLTWCSVRFLYLLSQVGIW